MGLTLRQNQETKDGIYLFCQKYRVSLSKPHFDYSQDSNNQVIINIKCLNTLYLTFIDKLIETNLLVNVFRHYVQTLIIEDEKNSRMFKWQKISRNVFRNKRAKI